MGGAGALTDAVWIFAVVLVLIILAAYGVFLVIVVLIAYLLTAITLMLFFRKVGVETWIAWVPFYNHWKWLEVGGQQGWFALLTLIPYGSIVTTVFLAIGMHRTGIAFGKDSGRVVPGLMFPSYIAIGWFNLPFTRYLLGTTLLSLAYFPIVFAFVYVLGSAAFTHLGNWTWIIILVPLTVLLVLRARVYFRRSGLEQDRVGLNQADP